MIHQAVPYDSPLQKDYRGGRFRSATARWGPAIRRALAAAPVKSVAARGWVADPVPAEEQLGFVPAWTTANGFRDTAVADGFVDQDAGD